jgi:hypothetical protein
MTLRFKIVGTPCRTAALLPVTLAIKVRAVLQLMVDHSIDNTGATVGAHFIVIDIESFSVIRVGFVFVTPRARVKRIDLHGCLCNGWRWRFPTLRDLDSARGNDCDVAGVAALLGIQPERRRVVAMAVEFTVA